MMDNQLEPIELHIVYFGHIRSAVMIAKNDPNVCLVEKLVNIPPEKVPFWLTLEDLYKYTDRHNCSVHVRMAGVDDIDFVNSYLSH